MAALLAKLQRGASAQYHDQYICRRKEENDYVDQLDFLRAQTVNLLADLHGLWRALQVQRGMACGEAECGCDGLLLPCMERKGERSNDSQESLQDAKPEPDLLGDSNPLFVLREFLRSQRPSEKLDKGKEAPSPSSCDVFAVFVQNTLNDLVIFKGRIPFDVILLIPGCYLLDGLSLIGISYRFLDKPVWSFTRFENSNTIRKAYIREFNVMCLITNFDS